MDPQNHNQPKFPRLFILLFLLLLDKGLGEDTTTLSPFSSEPGESDQSLSSPTLQPQPLLQAPSGVELEWKEDRMIGIRWKPAMPHPSSKSVSGYYVSWENQLLGDRVTRVVGAEVAEVVLQDLEPLTTYLITLRSFHRPTPEEPEEELVSEPSEPLFLETDVPRPGPPLLLSLTCASTTSILVQWRPPTTFRPSVDQYAIYYRTSPNSSFTHPPILVPVPPSHQLEHVYQYLIENLSSGLNYEVGLTAATRSNYDAQHYRSSNFSDIQTLSLDSSCGFGDLDGEHKAGDLGGFSFLQIGTFVVLGLLVLGLGAAGVLLYVYRCTGTRGGSRAKGHWRILERNSPGTRTSGSGEGRRRIIGEEDGGWEPCPAESRNMSVPSQLWPAHVAGLHADGDIGFSKEYEMIQAGSGLGDGGAEFTTHHSSHPDNKLKNRYLNILAYDHSLVIADGWARTTSSPNSIVSSCSPKRRRTSVPDYFNGNYIDGYRKACAYIGTQGPLPSTFETFWRVVWEHEVLVIVMITNLIERGRKKCDQYWPSEGTESYGPFSVRLIREESTATFITRTLGVRFLGSAGTGSSCSKKITSSSSSVPERKVLHFHYTNWPDHGTPSHNLPVLNFVRKSAGSNWGETGEGGPIIVHCSAGVGRTGTYIVLAEMLKQAKTTGEINVVDYLAHIRKQRNYLVQTEEQYIFIHDALLEAVQSGDTCMPLSHLPPYLHTLTHQTVREPSPDQKEGPEEEFRIITLLQRQYGLVTQFQPKPFHYSQATRPPNVQKNRKPDEPSYLPIDPYRVLLIPKPGTDGSDYINASFLPGHFKLREFIITQHPLESTILGFWQMCLDHNVNRLVVLSEVQPETELPEKPFHPFWPTLDEDLVFDNFSVKLTQETSRVGFVLRSFALNSQSDDVELSIEMIHSSSWPHHPEPSSGSSGPSEVFDLIQMVQDLDAEAQGTGAVSTGPIVVVDKYGGVEASTFCLLSTLCNQLDAQGTLDIYSYSKMYWEQRPTWTGENDLLNLYLLIDGLTKGRRNSEPLLPISSQPLLHLPPLHPKLPPTPLLQTAPESQSQLVEVEYRPTSPSAQNLGTGGSSEMESPVHALLQLEGEEEEEGNELEPNNKSQSGTGCPSPTSVGLSGCGSDENFRVSSICDSTNGDEAEEGSEKDKHPYEPIWIGPSSIPPTPSHPHLLIHIGVSDEVPGQLQSPSPPNTLVLDEAKPNPNQIFIDMGMEVTGVDVGDEYVDQDQSPSSLVLDEPNHFSNSTITQSQLHHIGPRPPAPTPEEPHNPRPLSADRQNQCAMDIISPPAIPISTSNGTSSPTILNQAPTHRGLINPTQMSESNSLEPETPSQEALLVQKCPSTDSSIPTNVKSLSTPISPVLFSRTENPKSRAEVRRNGKGSYITHPLVLTPPTSPGPPPPPAPISPSPPPPPVPISPKSSLSTLWQNTNSKVFVSPGLESDEEMRGKSNGNANEKCLAEPEMPCQSSSPVPETQRGLQLGSPPENGTRGLISNTKPLICTFIESNGNPCAQLQLPSPPEKEANSDDETQIPYHDEN